MSRWLRDALREARITSTHHWIRSPCLAWCSRPDGSNEFLNQRWLDYTGSPSRRRGVGGWKKLRYIPTTSALLDVWEGLLASGNSGELEARLRRADAYIAGFCSRRRTVA